ncbi:MAG: hypothetical protein WBI82_07265 [Sphaerochaeta sp.]
MPPFPPHGALYLTLLSPPSLGNGIIVMLLLLSLRWGINNKGTDRIRGYYPLHEERYLVFSLSNAS